MYKKGAILDEGLLQTELRSGEDGSGGGGTRDVSHGSQKWQERGTSGTEYQPVSYCMWRNVA